MPLPIFCTFLLLLSMTITITITLRPHLLLVGSTFCRLRWHLMESPMARNYTKLKIRILYNYESLSFISQERGDRVRIPIVIVIVIVIVCQFVPLFFLNSGTLIFASFDRTPPPCLRSGFAPEVDIRWRQYGSTAHHLLIYPFSGWTIHFLIQ